VEIDHVLIRVSDLDDAADELDAEHGVASVPGGRHPGWGTANRIVPLGETYLELVTVVDEREAAGSSFGRWVLETPPGPMGWCVRPASLETEAERLHLTVHSGSRATASGEQLTWRFAGFDQAAAEPSLPFFIEWGTPELFPGRIGTEHRSGPVDLIELALAGDADRIAEWLGPRPLPITVRPGAPSLDRVVLAGSAGQLVLRA
jgi:glyoxalase-like protein